MLHQHIHRLYTEVLVARNVDICKQMELNSQHDSNCFISFRMLMSLLSHCERSSSYVTKWTKR